MSVSKHILLADDDDDIRESIVAVLTDAGYQASQCSDGDEVIKALNKLVALRQPLPDLCILDVAMPNIGGLETAAMLKRDPTLRYIPTMLLTGRDTLDDIVAGFDAGADDYLIKPCREPELLARVRAALRIQSLYQELSSAKAETEAWRSHVQSCQEDSAQFGELVGNSAPMREVFTLIERVAVADVPVLIRGESGTGKELVAKEIHNRSARSSGPLIVQNCAAFQEHLLESALFGHVRGAFTGAVRDKAGLFQVANKGTLFLDEVGELSLPLQAKLLRVVQEGSFTPVGDTRERHVDVRIVAATHRPLEEMMERGEFRADLFYRLAVVPIKLPPLRDRSSDIKLLAQVILNNILKRRKLAKRELSLATLDLILQYPWPGNVRELQNELERAIIIAGERDTLLEPNHFSISLNPSSVLKNQTFSESRRVEDSPSKLSDNSSLQSSDKFLSGVENLQEAFKVVEQVMIRDALKRTKGNKSEAARILGISRSTLIAKVQEFEV